MPLSDYSQMEGQISEAPELEVLQRGAEVKARIVNVRTGIDKNDFSYFMPVFDVPAEPLVKEFSDFFTDLIDLDKLGEKAQAGALRKIRMFGEAFGIDWSKPFDFEEFVSLEGWVILGISKSDEYGEQNSVDRYVSK